MSPGKTKSKAPAPAAQAKKTAIVASHPRRSNNNRSRKCCDVHCNSLWSIWYGLVVTAFQAYIIYEHVNRFLTYIALPWPDGQQPYLELNIFVGLVGAGVVLLPFFVISFMFKIGNLANDGYKLGFKLSACAMDPPSILTRSSGMIRTGWHHGGPTAPFIHLVSAFCFMLPKIFIEAKLIEVGFLPKDRIWKTDLDWLVPHQDRLVILHFLTGGLITNSTTTTQAPYHHPADQIRQYLEDQETWWPVSPEFINYALALLVYAVRYPAVFWNTNKTFSFIFSLQLFSNALQNLMSIGGMSVMYKVQHLGPQNVLHRYEPFLLNPPICILLYLLSSCVILTSSCVLYMYGYHKLMAFIATERDKIRHHVVVMRNNLGIGEGVSLWAYFPHCSAMCVLIALAVCNAPLLYDFTLIYKGSLDGAVLVHLVATILHLFVWIVVWLVLTIKQKWAFKLRVTIGRGFVSSARSVKLLSDVDLLNNEDDFDGEEEEDDEKRYEKQAMMIVAFGKAFTVTDPRPKKLIMNTLTRAAIERDKALEMDEQERDERARLVVEQDPDKVVIVGGDSPHHATQVINEGASTCGSIAHVDNGGESEICSSSPLVHRHLNETGAEDDCDNLPPPPGHPAHLGAPSGHVLASRNSPSHMQCDLAGQRETASPSSSSSSRMVMVTNVSASCVVRKSPQIVAVHNPEVQEVQTPRSNRSVDSGLPHEDITTPRSDSISTASSASPPDHNQQHVPGMQQSQQHQQQLVQNHPLQQQHIYQQQQQLLQSDHRKSSSLDEIIVAQASDHVNTDNQSMLKTSSLHRGTNPNVVNGASGTGIYAETDSLVIRRRNRAAAKAGDLDEDPYGRCLNMRLTSFSDAPPNNSNSTPTPSDPRDPRIINLTPNSSASVSVASTPRQGSPVQHLQHQQLHQQQINPMLQFHTLPAQVHNSGNGNGFGPSGRMTNVAMTSNHNTLPARVSTNNISNPNLQQNGPSSARNSFNGSAVVSLPSVPSGRHFKPFDHRRLNPLAEIQENPCGMTEFAADEATTKNLPLIVQKTTRLPHLPTELRHTNYSSTNKPGTAMNGTEQRKLILMNPQVMEHRRDSANFSLTSSDSG